MNRALLVLALLLLPASQSHAVESGSESLRAGAMYLISHKSEIEINRGHFGLFSQMSDDQIEISFYETLRGKAKYSDSLTYSTEEQRRIKHDLFAYNRKEVELDSIREAFPEFFPTDEEPQCQNAFFPYTVCLIEK